MKISIDTNVLESMLYIWACLSDKEKIGDTFLTELATSPAMTAQYDDDFNAESVRKVLSAICNRERMNNPTKKESRFWNNNMWMMEDKLIPDSMLGPVKRLSARELEQTVQTEGDKNVVFYPGTTETSFAKGDTLYVNFFKIRADIWDDTKEPTIDEKSIKDFVADELNAM